MLYTHLTRYTNTKFLTGPKISDNLPIHQDRSTEFEFFGLSFPKYHVNLGLKIPLFAQKEHPELQGKLCVGQKKYIL